MVQVLVGALASLIVTVIVTESYIFRPVRSLAHRMHVHIGVLFSCFLCMGTWVGLGLGWLLEGPSDWWFVNGLAFHGLAYLLWTVVRLVDDLRIRLQR